MTDIAPSRFTSETSMDVTIPTLAIGTYSVDVTNSTGTGSDVFTVTPVPNSVPTNITATPDQSDRLDLPRMVTISGTNIFERPSYTERELFTQVAPDVSASDWKNGIAQNDGLIGKGVQATSAVPPGPDPIPYIEISSKIPITSGDTFFGISCFFKVNQINSIAQYLINIGNKLTNGVNAIDLTVWRPGGPYPNTSYVMFSCGDETQSGTDYGRTTSSRADNTIVVGKWYHLFAYMDFTDTIKRPHLFIDGVDDGTGFTQATFSSTTSFPVYDYATINAIGYLSATGGPYLSDSNLSVCDLYMSNDPDFKNHLDKYKNLPTIEVN